MVFSTLSWRPLRTSCWIVGTAVSVSVSCCVVLGCRAAGCRTGPGRPTHAVGRVVPDRPAVRQGRTGVGRRCALRPDAVAGVGRARRDPGAREEPGETPGTRREPTSALADEVKSAHALVSRDVSRASPAVGDPGLLAAVVDRDRDADDHGQHASPRGRSAPGCIQDSDRRRSRTWLSPVSRPAGLGDLRAWLAGAMTSAMIAVTKPQPAGATASTSDTMPSTSTVVALRRGRRPAGGRRSRSVRRVARLDRSHGLRRLAVPTGWPGWPGWPVLRAAAGRRLAPLLARLAPRLARLRPGPLGWSAHASRTPLSTGRRPGRRTPVTRGSSLALTGVRGPPRRAVAGASPGRGRSRSPPAARPGRSPEPNGA